MRNKSSIAKEIYYMGIDPGQDGCLTILYPDDTTKSFPFQDHNVIEVLSIPEIRKLLKKTILTIEEPQSFGPGGNPKTLLALGKHYGYLTGVLETLDIAYMCVYPKDWKKVYKITGLPKSASIDKVHELYPKANLFRTPRCTTEHDGIADSVLIADYGKQQNKKQ